jgi:hypothetical protein
MFFARETLRVRQSIAAGAFMHGGVHLLFSTLPVVSVLIVLRVLLW